jgi:hypothetical protein
MDGSAALLRLQSELAMGAVLKAEDQALTVEAAASCALRDGAPARAAELLAAQRPADDTLAPGFVADVARRRARAAVAASALGDNDAAARFRQEALQALQGARLGAHPLAATLAAPAAAAAEARR